MINKNKNIHQCTVNCKIFANLLSAIDSVIVM